MENKCGKPTYPERTSKAKRRKPERDISDNARPLDFSTATLGGLPGSSLPRPSPESQLYVIFLPS